MVDSLLRSWLRYWGIDVQRGVIKGGEKLLGVVSPS